MKLKKTDVKSEKSSVAKSAAPKRCSTASKTTKGSAKPKARRVGFSVTAKPGSKVFLAGSFNNWDARSKKMVDKEGNGFFTGALNLQPGEYQYKFVIDDVWCADPECMEWVQNEHGTLNSVRHVE